MPQANIRTWAGKGLTLHPLPFPPTWGPCALKQHLEPAQLIGAADWVEKKASASAQSSDWSGSQKGVEMSQGQASASHIHHLQERDVCHEVLLLNSRDSDPFRLRRMSAFDQSGLLTAAMAQQVHPGHQSTQRHESSWAQAEGSWGCTFLHLPRTPGSPGHPRHHL